MNHQGHNRIRIEIVRVHRGHSTGTCTATLCVIEPRTHQKFESFKKILCTTTHQQSHHHPIAHHHPVIKDIFQDSARLITQSRKTIISTKRKVRTATAPGAPSRGDLREKKDSPLPVRCGPGASKIQVVSCGSSPCGTSCIVQNEPGRRTRYLPLVGKCRPSQPQTKSRSGSRAARLPALRNPQRTHEAGPQVCRHPEGETSRKTAGARDHPRKRTTHPHPHTI